MSTETQRLQADESNAPALHNVARIYTQGRYRRASVLDGPGDALVRRDDAMNLVGYWRQVAFLRWQAFEDMTAQRDAAKASQAADAQRAELGKIAEVIEPHYKGAGVVPNANWVIKEYLDRIGARDERIEELEVSQSAQSAELAALKADIAEYVHIASEQATEIEALRDHLASLRNEGAENEALRKDAERYEKLFTHCRVTPEHWGGRWSIVVDGPAPKTQDSRTDFDAAIDAAMQTKEAS